MAVSKISAQSFLKAMTLPDEQRRKVLETLGAKMMDQFRSDREPAPQATLTVRPLPKTA